MTIVLPCLTGVRKEKIRWSAAARTTWHLRMLTMMPDELATGLFSRYSPSLKLRDPRSRSEFLPMISIALIVFKVS
jgi:hypothetical protein